MRENGRGSSFDRACPVPGVSLGLYHEDIFLVRSCVQFLVQNDQICGAF